MLSITGFSGASGRSGRTASAAAADRLSWPAILRCREIQSLNGIRGAAITAVVVSHAWRTLASIGPYAVACFFVLSGFLITNLLLEERERTGATVLRKFYARRAMRIVPAFWVFCGLYVAIYFLTGRQVDWPAFAACALFVSNYYMGIHGPGATMNHTWFLAVEVQFYLLWPAIFRRVAGHQTALIRGLGSVIVCVWALRVILQYGLGVRGEYIYCAFETRLDGLALGCLCAILAQADRLPGWLIKCRWLGLAAVAAICALAVSPIPNATMYSTPAFALLILHGVWYYDTAAYRWLSWAPLRRLGTWSYSIYLYHVMTKRIVPVSTGWFRVPLEIAVAVLLGAASYYIVERPALSLRDRIFGDERPPVL
jgi:peptidoglycan/LPS O-acetylase OafA/YrhL